MYPSSCWKSQIHRVTLSSILRPAAAAAASAAAVGDVVTVVWYDTSSMLIIPMTVVAGTDGATDLVDCIMAGGTRCGAEAGGDWGEVAGIGAT